MNCYYQEHAPSHFLAPYIECYWTLSSPFPYFIHKELIIPGGRAEMIFSFNDALKWYNSDSRLLCSKQYFVMGQRDKFFFIQSDKPIDIFGVRFRQGGLSAFVAFPIAEVTNFFHFLDVLFGNQANEWIERMNETSFFSDKVSCIEKILSEMLVEQKDFRLCSIAMSELRNHASNTRIHSFCASEKIHYKKLERTFLKITGYSPKPFLKINRLFKALHLTKQQTNNLTEISYQCKYFDQSHFIRECKEFTGKTPRQIMIGEFKIADLLLKKMPV
jgi:AraC-like DNA-binding protein